MHLRWAQHLTSLQFKVHREAEFFFKVFLDLTTIEQNTHAVFAVT